MQAELTGICHWCGKEIGTTAGVRLEFAIPVGVHITHPMPDDMKPNVFTTEKRWVHSITEDCDGVVRKPCPDHFDHWYATEGGEGCPRCMGNGAAKPETRLDGMIRLRLQLGNQGFDTDDLSDDEVSERFELAFVRECGFCRGTSNLVGDSDAPAVCRVCQRTDFVEVERAVSKPSHLRRKSEAGWTECGLPLARGLSVSRPPWVVEAFPTCPECKRQEVFNIERSARQDPNRRR